MTRQAAAESAARDHTGRIGASRAAACLGRDPWCSPVQAWLEIRGDAPEREDENNGPAWWGSALEHVVAKHGYEVQTGRRLARVNRTLHLPGFPAAVNGPNAGAPALTCHLDRRVVGHPRIYQGKCRSVWAGRDGPVTGSGWGEPGTDDVPEPVLIQVAIEMELADAAFTRGVEAVDIGVLFGGHDFQVYEVDRDPAVGALLVDRLREWFIRHIVEGIAPPPMSEADCKALWRRARLSSRDATDDEIALVRELAAAKAERKAAEEREKALAFRVRRALGEAEELTAQMDVGGVPKVVPLVRWPQTWDLDERRLAEIAPPDVDLDAFRTKAGKFSETRFRKAHPKLWSAAKVDKARGDMRLTKYGEALVEAPESEEAAT